MHALVLGGAGECGRHLVTALVGAPEIDRVTLVDADGDAGRSLVAQLNAPSVDVVELDISDSDALVEQAAASDCLVNCTPFPLFDGVIAAAIKARVHYVDLISEPIEEQRQRARNAGIVAISGLGMSPGTTNVLCAHAAAEFDLLRECYINFASFRTIAPSPGLLDTILWELSDDCPTRHVYHDGRWDWRPSLEGSHLVTFPGPVGPQRVYVMPHTETNTLPVSFPELRHVAVRGTWNPELMQDVAVLNKYGLLDDVPLGDGGLTSFEATKSRIWQKLGGQRDSFPDWSSFTMIEVLGERDGEPVRREYHLSHARWGTQAVGKMAGVHAAVGVRLLARHGTGPGVGFVDPERYFDPHEYVPEIQRIPDVHLSWNDTALPAGRRARTIDRDNQEAPDGKAVHRR